VEHRDDCDRKYAVGYRRAPLLNAAEEVGDGGRERLFGGDAFELMRGDDFRWDRIGIHAGPARGGAGRILVERRGALVELAFVSEHLLAADDGELRRILREKPVMVNKRRGA